MPFLDVQHFRHDALGLGLVEMAAQEQVAVLVDQGTGFVLVELGQVGPGVVQ